MAITCFIYMNSAIFIYCNQSLTFLVFFIENVVLKACVTSNLVTLYFSTLKYYGWKEGLSYKR